MKHRSWSENTSIIPEIKFLSGNLPVKELIYSVLYKEWKKNKAQFKDLSFRLPNLIPPIKYMKRSIFESIKSDMS